MLRPLNDTLSRYVHVSRWLARDLFGEFGRQVVGVLAARLGGVGGLVVALALVTGYARLLEQDRTFELLGTTYHARQSVQLLAIVGATALVALLSSAALTYLGNRWALILRRDYEKFCGRRVLRLTGEAVRLWMPQAERNAPEQFLRTLARRDASYCGRVARQLVLSVIPSGVVLIVAVPIVLYIHVWLTVIVLAIIAGSMALHYRLNVRAARRSLERESYQTATSRTYLEMIRAGANRDRPRADNSIDRRFEQTPIRDFFRAEVDFRLASSNSQFVSDAATAIVIVIILVVLGGGILTQGTGWSTLIVYLFAMRYSMGQMRNIMSGVADINRYYHQIRRYFLFVESSRLPHDETPAPAEFVLRVATDSALDGSLHRLDLAPGRRVALQYSTPLNRYVLVDLFDALVDAGDDPAVVDRLLSSAALVTARTRLEPADSLASALDLSDAQLRRCSQMLREAGLLNQNNTVLPTKDGELCDGPVRKTLDDETRIALLLAAAEASGRAIIVTEAAALDRITAAARETLLNCVSSAAMLIATPQPTAARAYGAAFVAVMDHQQLVGLGSPDWYDALGAAAPVASAAHTAGADDDPTAFAEYDEDED